MKRVIAAGLALAGALSADSIIRKPLLKADIAAKTVQTADVREIQFAPHQKTGVHVHPCPVIVYIATGTVLFQVEGQPQRIIHAGEALLEPANAKILQFDAGNDPTKFIATYLLAPGQTKLIRFLQ